MASLRPDSDPLFISTIILFHNPLLSVLSSQFFSHGYLGAESVKFVG